MEQAKLMRITVERLPTVTVMEQAIVSYNAWNEERALRTFEAWEPATESSDPAFLDRITLNYIRHSLTSYDTHLEQLVGQIGVRQAGKVIRRRMYDAIAQAYPAYAQECERQMQARYGALSEQQEEA